MNLRNALQSILLASSVALTACGGVGVDAKRSANAGSVSQTTFPSETTAGLISRQRYVDATGENASGCPAGPGTTTNVLANIDYSNRTNNQHYELQMQFVCFSKVEVINLANGQVKLHLVGLGFSDGQLFHRDEMTLDVSLLGRDNIDQFVRAAVAMANLETYEASGENSGEQSAGTFAQNLPSKNKLILNFQCAPKDSAGEPCVQELHTASYSRYRSSSVLEPSTAWSMQLERRTTGFMQYRLALMN